MTDLYSRSDILAAFSDDPDGLEAVRNHRSNGRAATFATPVGSIVIFDGRKLHSGRDPLREANRFAANLKLDSAQIIVLLGYGSGYAARAIARCNPRATIVVFEPNLEVLSAGLQHGDVPKQVALVTRPARLGQLLYALLRGHDKGLVVKWTASLRVDGPSYDVALTRISEAIDRANVRHRTARLRGPAWLRNYLENLPAVADSPGLPALRRQFVGTPALARAGITPTAVVAIESLDVTQQLESLPFVSKVPAFLELTGHPALWRLPWTQRIPVSVDTNSCANFSEKLDRGFRMSAGFCVANTAVAIAHAMGCDPIILLGSDLAYTEGRVYAQGTSFERMRVELTDDGYVALQEMDAKREIERRSGDAQLGNHAPDRMRRITAPAWDGVGRVTSSNEFMMFRDWYAFAAETLHAEGITTINATEGGARIPGWEHMPLSDAIERHHLAMGDLRAPVRQRLEAVLTEAPLPVAALRRAVVHERDTVKRLQHIAKTAPNLVTQAFGTPRTTKRNVKKLHRYNAEVRRLFAGAPLCSEACFAPIDDLSNLDTIDVDTFYNALVGPLRELDEKLARLLQTLSTELEREPSRVA